jgi:hemerythrin
MPFVAQPLDVDLDLLHLLAVASENALPRDRMRAVFDRELVRLSTTIQEHFANEEEVARRRGSAEDLEMAHRMLSERLARVRELVHRTSIADLQVELTELLDALADHERAEVAPDLR